MCIRDSYEEKFAALDPAEASKRCGVPFADGRFTVMLLGTNYEIRWPEYAISSDTESAFALKNLPCQTFLLRLSLIHISEPTRQAEISYAVFCLKKKKKNE